MRRLALATVLVTGCGFEHGIFNGGRDASPNDGPRVDAAIVDAAIVDVAVDASSVTADAAIDAPASLDTDGDGVLDGVDNCPAIANANQRDHDADARGDECDRCPHLASSTDPDGDGDDVGDACDPRPATGGDSRAFWEGFYDANATANWTATGDGTWSVANGVLTQSSTTTAVTTHALVAPITVTRAAVTSRVRIVALGTGTFALNMPHASVAAGVAQDQSYWCSAVADSSNGNRIFATTIWGTNVNFPNTAWNGTLAANSELQLTTALLGTNNDCTAVQSTTTANVSGPIGPTSGAVQVATRTAAASFDYLFVVSIGN